jgi:hypothetical protein
MRNHIDVWHHRHHIVRRRSRHHLCRPIIKYHRPAERPIYDIGKANQKMDRCQLNTTTAATGLLDKDIFKQT